MSHDGTAWVGRAVAGRYESSYGISTDGTGLSLKFVTRNQAGTNVGSRTYLLSEGGDTYEMFKLKNREFTFTTDVSTLPCGQWRSEPCCPSPRLFFVVASST